MSHAAEWTRVTHSYLHVCDITRLEVWHDSFIKIHDSSMRVTRLIHVTRSRIDKSNAFYVCAITCWEVQHDSFMNSDDFFMNSDDACMNSDDAFVCVIWMVHTCDMTHSYMRLDSFISTPSLFRRVTWLFLEFRSLMHTFDMSHSCHKQQPANVQTWMSHVTHIHFLSLSLSLLLSLSLCSFLSLSFLFFLFTSTYVDICGMTHSGVRHDLYISVA